MESEVYCPDCHRPMKKRTAKKNGRPFWGCPAFFPFDAVRNPDGYDPSKGESQCKGVVWNAGKKQEAIVRQPIPKFKGSAQQEAIWREMEHGTQHLMVHALAGCGKTTTIVVGAARMKGTVLALAFNRRIAAEMKAKMPENVQTFTFNAFGNSVVSKASATKVLFEANKTWIIMDENQLLPPNLEKAEEMQIKIPARKLVSLCKNRLVEPTEENLAMLCDRYLIEINDAERVFSIVPKVLDISFKMRNVIDYDDQLWFPIVHKLPFPTFNNLIVDEVQDVNAVRIEMMFKACPNGRIIAVGDENQAIYGFSGSDTEALQTLEQRMAA